MINIERLWQEYCNYEQVGAQSVGFQFGNDVNIKMAGILPGSLSKVTGKPKAWRDHHLTFQHLQLSAAMPLWAFH